MGQLELANKVLVLKDFRPPKEVGIHYRLLCMTGKEKGSAYYLKSQRIVLGRATSCDIIVYDHKSSREHIELKKIQNNYFLTDLNSQNGVVVNDVKIKQKQLEDGDQIIIGETIYRFNEFNIRPEKKNDIAQKEKKKKDKKGSPLILIVVLLGIVLYFMDDTEKKEQKNKAVTLDNQFVPLDNDLAKTIRRNESERSREVRRQLETIFQRGLRELREKNYFRAIEEFEQALRLSPKNSTAKFYKSLAERGLFNEIEENLISANKDREALRYEKAINSYCNVLRLLKNYKERKEFKRAESHIRSLEKVMGKGEDEIKCF